MLFCTVMTKMYAKHACTHTCAHTHTHTHTLWSIVCAQHLSGLVSKEVDCFELAEVHQRQGKGLVPANREDINTDLAPCRERGGAVGEGQRGRAEGRGRGEGQ